jgi:hypothetical protein
MLSSLHVLVSTTFEVAMTEDARLGGSIANRVHYDVGGDRNLEALFGASRFRAGLPGSGRHPYSQSQDGGADIMMDSVRHGSPKTESNP